MKPYTKEDLQALRTLAHGSDTERHRFLATVRAAIEERDRLREMLRTMCDLFETQDEPEDDRWDVLFEQARAVLEDK